MLAQPYRLSQKSDFDKLKAKGTKVDSEHFGLSFLKRADSKPSRFGFIISTKVSKKAVVRNKIKRVLSEAVRQNISYIEPGFNAVFLVKTNAGRVYSAELVKEAKEALKKADLLK